MIVFLAPKCPKLSLVNAFLHYSTVRGLSCPISLSLSFLLGLYSRLHYGNCSLSLSLILHPAQAHTHICCDMDSQGHIVLNVCVCVCTRV